MVLKCNKGNIADNSERRLLIAFTHHQHRGGGQAIEDIRFSCTQLTPKNIGCSPVVFEGFESAPGKADATRPPTQRGSLAIGHDHSDATQATLLAYMLP